MSPEIERALLLAMTGQNLPSRAEADYMFNILQRQGRFVSPQEMLRARMANTAVPQDVLQAAQGATFGLADEGAAAIELANQLMRGASWGEAKRKALALRNDLHNVSKEYAEEHPYRSLALQVAGGVAGPYAMNLWPGKVAKMAEPVAGRAADVVLNALRGGKVARAAAHYVDDAIKAVPGSSAVLGTYGYGQAESMDPIERLGEAGEFIKKGLALSVMLAPMFHAGGNKIKAALQRKLGRKRAKLVAKWAQDTGKLDAKHAIKHELLAALGLEAHEKASKRKERKE